MILYMPLLATVVALWFLIGVAVVIISDQMINGGEIKDQLIFLCILATIITNYHVYAHTRDISSVRLLIVPGHSYN